MILKIRRQSEDNSVCWMYVDNIHELNHTPVARPLSFV
jgi:hypothetical protein